MNPNDLLAQQQALLNQALKDADFLDESLWPQHFEWLRERLETMHKVFAPMVKTLKLEGAE